MIASLQKIPVPHHQSFSIRTEISRGFYNQWHYHPEIELMYIAQGSGTGFFGSSVINLKEGDLILLGSNLPHMLKSAPEVYETNDPGDITETIVVHFLPDILQSFLALPENKNIQLLIKEIAAGVMVNGETKTAVISILQSLRYCRDSKRLILLLEILQTISDSKDWTTINNTKLKPYFNKNDENRLNRIYHYTLNNFMREITLEKIADIVHMSPHSFCRYFRSRTQKRYSLFLLEVRVNHACKLLTSTYYSIAVISYESGFMNFSNFNRHFKLITGKTPSEYKRLYALK